MRLKRYLNVFGMTLVLMVMVVFFAGCDFKKESTPQITAKDVPQKTSVKFDPAKAHEFSDPKFVVKKLSERAKKKSVQFKEKSDRFAGKGKTELAEHYNRLSELSKQMEQEFEKIYSVYESEK